MIPSSLISDLRTLRPDRPAEEVFLYVRLICRFLADNARELQLNDGRFIGDVVDFAEVLRQIANAARRADVPQILCDQIEAPTLAEHTKYVEEFLVQMYATMIDPVEQPKMRVAELCELLLKTAVKQRQQLHNLLNPVTYRMLHEQAAGMGLCPEFFAIVLRQIANAARRADVPQILCDQIEAPTLAEHTKYVEEFLVQMYATMIDPVEQPKMRVAELCELLLKTAVKQRQQLHNLLNPVTYRMLHEQAAGMGLCPEFFAISGIDPDAPAPILVNADSGRPPQPHATCPHCPHAVHGSEPCPETLGAGRGCGCRGSEA